MGSEYSIARDAAEQKRCAKCAAQTDADEYFHRGFLFSKYIRRYRLLQNRASSIHPVAETSILSGLSEFGM
jgi:hypothetical protein